MKVVVAVHVWFIHCRVYCAIRMLPRRYACFHVGARCEAYQVIGAAPNGGDGHALLPGVHTRRTLCYICAGHIERPVSARRVSAPATAPIGKPLLICSPVSCLLPSCHTARGLQLAGGQNLALGAIGAR